MDRHRIGTLTAIVAATLMGSPQSEGKTVHSEGLNAKQRRLVPVAMFTATGDQTKLKEALAQGLDSGWSISELKEVLVQMYAYTGLPRSLNALNTFIDLLDERRARGIADEPGREPSPLPSGKSSVEVGTEIQTRLLGGPATGRYIAFSPAIDAFLKGHLFGDIFGRDNLDVQSRELATISGLAALDGLTSQLASHLNVGLNVGLTEAQLSGLVAVIGEKAGTNRADNAAKVLTQVLAARGTTRPPQAAAMPGQGSPPRQTVVVRRRDAQPTEPAPAEHFTGAARVQGLFQASDPARGSGASVTFEPGARTAWHSHPLGQTLIVTAGFGWVQQWGEPAHQIREGDVVSIPPNVKHWHGATAATAMTHLALQEQLGGATVQWMEAVSDEQYRHAAGQR